MAERSPSARLRIDSWRDLHAVESKELSPPPGSFGDFLVLHAGEDGPVTPSPGTLQACARLAKYSGFQRSGGTRFAARSRGIIVMPGKRAARGDLRKRFDCSARFFENGVNVRDAKVRVRTLWGVTRLSGLCGTCHRNWVTFSGGVCPLSPMINPDPATSRHTSVSRPSG